MAQAAPAVLLLLACCSQPPDLGLHHIAMPGADDASHPAAARDPSATDNTLYDNSVQGMWTRYMTFPDSDAK